MITVNVIERLYEYAVNRSETVAVVNPYSKPAFLTYKQLYVYAYHLAEYLRCTINDSNPIVVYGHKNPYMLVSFLACVLSGHAYCPVDESIPNNRIEMILSQTKSSVVLATEHFVTSRTGSIGLDEIIKICGNITETIPDLPKYRVMGSQTFYIIFTSGSTGIPKGVEITLDNLDNFLAWSSTLGEENPYKEGTVFLNQAPFSFDLSVMDLYTSLYCGCTLCMMEKKIQASISGIIPFLIENKITTFVSTPSFVNMCLLDKEFIAEKVPTLNSFLFCGETLANKTALKLIERFPDAVIQNTYGPTESTVAVSNIRITKEILEKYDPLPVGYAKNGTEFIISDIESVNKNGIKVGEILITGNTLAKGYFGREDLTSKAFILYNNGSNNIRAYRTGDLGYLKEGMLFYCGRIDLQIKLKGYRIELGDIENSILKNKLVSMCVVIPRLRGGIIKSLVAFIVLVNNEIDNNAAENIIKNSLEKLLPIYMIPQNYIFLKSIPMTSNGKVDRGKLVNLIDKD